MSLGKRKDIIKYLKRYYTNKGLTIIVERDCEPIANFGSKVDDILYDYSYYIHILQPQRIKLSHLPNYTCKKSIEIDKKMHKRIRNMVPVLDNDYSEYISVENFIAAITTREDIIDTILTDLLVDENIVTDS